MQEQPYDLKRTVEMFRRTDRLHRRLFERQAVEAFGIHRSQHIALMHISHNPGTSQKDLASEFQISPAAVAVTLKKLECGGFIERSADGRCNNICITEKGRTVVNETHKLFSAIDYAMFDGLTAAEMETFTACLEKILGNLQAAGEKTPAELKGRSY